MLILAETGARIAIRLRWGPEKIRSMTSHSSIHGQFMGHPYLPYVLAPNVYGHNALGFRGKPFEPEKPKGLIRIVCMGSSSTYGVYVSSDDAYPSQLEKLLRQEGIQVEVINAGVPGWVSTENLLYLQLCILPLKPDIVVVYEGRNEVFPQAFNGYKPDYSHYRRGDYNMARSNYLHKCLFRISNLLMILATYREDRLGWSSVEENPVYGCIDFRNRPSSSQVMANLDDPARNDTYRGVVQRMISICRGAHCKIVFCTFACRAEKLATGNLENDPAIYEALQAQVEENNAIVREECARNSVFVVETASLAEEADLFIDDCHMSAHGHAKQARMVFNVLIDEENGFLASSGKDNKTGAQP